MVIITSLHMIIQAREACFFAYNMFTNKETYTRTLLKMYSGDLV